MRCGFVNGGNVEWIDHCHEQFAALNAQGHNTQSYRYIRWNAR
jgi:hypothetical protein